MSDDSMKWETQGVASAHSNTVATGEYPDGPRYVAMTRGRSTADLAALIDRFEVDMMHAPTRHGGDELRAEIADYTHRTHRERDPRLDDLLGRDWAEDGAPTLLDSWRRNVEEGVLEWGLRELPAAAADYIRNEDVHGDPADPGVRDDRWRDLAGRYRDATGELVGELGRRQMTAMLTAQRWATELSAIALELADPRDIPALSVYLQRGHAAGYDVLNDVRRVLADDRPLGEHPGRALMLRLSNVWDEQRLDNHPGAQLAARRLDDPEVSLPPGYSIAECGVPGVPPRYQVLQVATRSEQFIGMRENREEAAQLAHHHHSRVVAERAAAAMRPPQPPPAPCR